MRRALRWSLLAGMLALILSTACSLFYPAPPAAPVGPATGLTDVAARFAARFSELKGNNVRFQFDYGDGRQELTDFVAKTDSGRTRHAWAAPGQYSVRVAAEDELGSTTAWSAGAAITIRKSDAYPDHLLLNLPVNPGGYVMGMLPDGSEIYLLNYPANDPVTVLRTLDNTVVDTLRTATVPNALVALPNSQYVYVASDPGRKVSVIRTADHTVVKNIPLGRSPRSLATSATGDYVYVVMNDTTPVRIIRTSDDSIVGMLTIRDTAGHGLLRLLASPDGQKLYALFENRILALSTDDYRTLDSVVVGKDLGPAAFLPGGDYLYVSDKGVSSLYVIRTSDDSVVARIPLEGSAGALAAMPDGQYVYAAVGYDVCVIRTADDTVVATTHLSSSCGDLAIPPSGIRVYVAHGATVGLIGFY